MYTPGGDLYKLARIRYEDRQSEAIERQTRVDTNESKLDGFGRLQRVAMTIGTALLPLGESLRGPISEHHSVDIPT